MNSIDYYVKRMISALLTITARCYHRVESLLVTTHLSKKAAL